jgi:hypothetical protein
MDPFNADAYTGFDRQNRVSVADLTLFIVKYQ